MKRILFVEDDALVADIYSKKLAEEGYEVAVAEDGLAAMGRLPEFKPDLVVLDLLMPKLSGVDVLRFMRQNPELKSTRVVVLSNWFLGNMVEQIEPLKVDASLAKSKATPALLVEIIHKLLADSGLPGGASNAAPASAPRQSRSPAAARAMSAAPREPEQTPGKESDVEFRSRMRREFLERIPEIFKGTRQLCGQFIEAEESPVQLRLMEDLHRKVGFLTQMTAMAGYTRVAELSGTLEALLFELREKPSLASDSCRHTIVSTVAFLADFLDRAESVDIPNRPSAILVVDDDAVSNRAVVFTLSRAKLSATSVTDPLEALKRLEQSPCDLLLLDINMPGLDGLELCERIRALPLHKRTPVIFVTILSDFKTRARAILSSGNDLITKPILPVELCVKVITHLLKAG